MGRTFVIGDIHGAYQALLQCLERSRFDNEEDRLICLGDVCDGWPQVRECVARLMEIRQLVYLLGNHDQWALNWMKDGESENTWLSQGGRATMDSYKAGVPEAHRHFLENARPYLVEENKLFVHAGIPPDKRPEECGLDLLIWDRTLPVLAMGFAKHDPPVQLTSFEEVYIGHTPIEHRQPMKYCEVWMMDTGAGWSGVLSMMDVNSKEVFISDAVPSLYPGVAGRRRG